MSELYFENVVEIGNLYLEHTFLSFEDEPIFFTCVDKEKRLYLCLCSDIRESQRWIVSKSDTEILESLIDCKIDMLSAICKPEKLVMIVRNLQGEESSLTVDTKEVNLLDLPEKGTFLRCDIAKALNYLVNKKFEDYSVYSRKALANMAENSLKIVKEYRFIFSSFIQNLNDMAENVPSKAMETAGNQKYCVVKQTSYKETSEEKNMENISDDYLYAA